MRSTYVAVLATGLLLVVPASASAALSIDPIKYGKVGSPTVTFTGSADDTIISSPNVTLTGGNVDTLGGTPVSTTVQRTGARWSATLTLPEGVDVVYVRQEGASNPDPMRVIVDLTAPTDPPTIAFNSAVGTSDTSGIQHVPAHGSIFLRAAERGATFECSFDGLPLASCGAPLPRDPNVDYGDTFDGETVVSQPHALPPGRHVLQARTVDIGGRPGPIGVRTVIAESRDVFGRPDIVAPVTAAQRFQTPNARVAVRVARTVRVPSSGSVPVTLTNANGFPVSAAVQLKSGGRRAARRSASLKAKGRATVRLRLDRRTRASLRRAHRRRAQIAVVLTDTVGQKRTVRATTTLRGRS